MSAEMEFASEDEYWEKAFHVFDANSNGVIDIDELENLLRVCKLNPTPEQVREIVAEYGTGQSISGHY